MITPEYRAKGKADAIEESKKARQKMAKAKTKRAYREAEEELLFWQGKLAFYEHAKK